MKSVMASCSVKVWYLSYFRSDKQSWDLTFKNLVLCHKFINREIFVCNGRKLKLYISASLNKGSIFSSFHIQSKSEVSPEFVFFTGSLYVLCFGHSMWWLLCSILRENLWGMLMNFIPLLDIYLENII